MANDTERIELRLTPEEKRRWVVAAWEADISLSEWIRRRCTHQTAEPEQNHEAARRTSLYLGPRNAKVVRVPDYFVVSMLREYCRGLPPDIKIQDCRVTPLGLYFFVSSNDFPFVHC